MTYAPTEADREIEIEARLQAVEAQAERIAGKLELNEKLREAQERKAAQEAKA